MVRNPRLWMITAIVLFLLTCGAVDLHGFPAKPAPRVSHPTGHAKKAKLVRVAKRSPVPKRQNFIFAKFPDFRGVRGPQGPLALQNRVADDLGLRRFDEDWMIIVAMLEGQLVPVRSTSPRLFVATGSGASGAIYGYAFPETVRYIEELPKRLPSVKQLKITSLVRSEEYQKLLATPSFPAPWVFGRKKKHKRIPNPRYNRNAALCGKEGTEHCSPHLTGFAFDISVRGLSTKEITAIGNVFDKDEKNNLVIAIYEPNMAHYHVMVIPPRP